jgi:NAD(P)H-dependent flavin oxidoreductase YrpB (nitropropane dioxygenase family)
MANNLCASLGIEFPLFAFSHCRDVVAAVSKAGGFGVLGATAFNPEQLEVELAGSMCSSPKICRLATKKI